MRIDLNRQKLDNLVVFARLLGYVRYFHPSDRAAETNWHELAITGVRSVETAKEPEILIQKLQAIFTPIAPTVQIFATEESSTVSPRLQKPDTQDSLQLVTWEHYGVKGDMEEDYSPYYSKRVYWDGSQNQITDELISKYQPFKADLGGGVSCLIPLALFAENGKTLPHIPKTEATNPTNYSVNDRATRLAIIILAWNVWQHFYPYFDVVAVDWLEELKTALKSAATDIDTAAFNKTLQRLVAKLEDGHGIVNLLHQNIGDRFIFPFTWDWVEDSLVITYVLSESEIDLHPGDVILKIDGVPAVEVISDREQFISSATSQWKRFMALGRMLRGEEATSVELEVRSIKGELKTVVARRHILNSLESGFSLPLFWQWRDEQLVITYVTTEAAEKIQPDDIVLSINGKPVEEAIAEKIQLLSQQGAEWFLNQQKKDQIKNALKELSNGAKDSNVILEVQSPSEESRIVELSRTLQSWDRKEPRPAKIHQLRSGIVYIDFDQINDLDFQQALPLLESATGIIIDLRGYPRVSKNLIGHLIDEPVTSARWYIPQVKYPDRQQLDFDFSNWSVEPKKPKLKAKVVFMTNCSAISYAETYLGIIEHYHLAEIVGQPTAGTNGNVNELILPGGYLIWWTGMKVLKHDGSRHHGVGILPTVPVERTIKGIAKKRDEFLERAIEIII
ncbi:MAG: S41 family peptidase [Xenococcaceae cyanobacterium MO_188.B29]|nr:S41 family peptidase [Xenococcaceae cyanobacterium MO_188.B29]